MSIVPPQKWCGQTQPHGPHTWLEQQASGMPFYMACAGHSGRSGGDQ